jgi:hypothetical protein
VFLRGTVVQYSDCRILIKTSFISGSSGCPLFDNNQSLTSFVHGSTKHRASRSFHNNNNDEGSGHGLLVYADRVPDQTKFSPVPSCYYKHLQAAEGIDDKLAANPDDKELYSKLASTYLKTVVGSATTLTEAMRLLHDIIWSQGADDGITLTTSLVVLHRTSGKEKAR